MRPPITVTVAAIVSEDACGGQEPPVCGARMAVKGVKMMAEVTYLGISLGAHGER
jgi:hypothetical protein